MSTDDHPDRILVMLDDVLAARGMTLTQLAERVGLTLANM